MRIKKVFSKIHLWLGLITGLVVFIIAITGAIYCFAPELQKFTQSYTQVEANDQNFLPPSQIQKIAEKALPGKSILRIYYGDRDQSVVVWFSKKDNYDQSVFIDPYTGEVLKVRDNEKDFISVVLKIHRTLLIPYGHEIIKWSTVIFLIMLISGLILWWPKNRRTAKHGFKIKWNAHPKRLNYDLHKVLGFYASWIVIFSALTGLMFAFKGFADFTYQITGAKYSVVKKNPPLSDTSAKLNKDAAVLDRVWMNFENEIHKNYARVMFVLPTNETGAILVRANPELKTLYKSDFRYFDQYTGNEIDGAFVWGNYKDAKTVADNIKRMNYDIHTGAIFGLPGRVVLFFAALIVASLPVTGFYFYWGKRKKARRRRG
jgi:uncharacterized iron-regulated membrane protein